MLRTVTFPAGEDEVSFDVEITSDDETEADESFVLQLSNPVGGIIEQYKGETTIFIEDDDGECRSLLVTSHTHIYAGVVLFRACRKSVEISMLFRRASKYPYVFQLFFDDVLKFRCFFNESKSKN